MLLWVDWPNAYSVSATSIRPTARESKSLIPLYVQYNQSLYSADESQLVLLLENVQNNNSFLWRPCQCVWLLQLDSKSNDIRQHYKRQFKYSSQTPKVCVSM